MDNLDKTISIFDIASDSNESGPKGLIKKFWPEWQPIQELGRGSYGTVYKCVRKENNIESIAAVKIISIPQNKSEIEGLHSEGMTNEDVSTYYNNIVTDFGNEISLMEQLKGHPNIVGIEDYKIKMQDNKIGWDILIRMELLTTFSSYIKNNTLTEDDIIKLGTDILTALEVCEKRNIVHRDIKPENIFVNDFGNFKLGDFGIAKRFESLGASHSQKGTFNYMAPEVASGTHYDSTVDIYSLGLVLYRLANNNCLPFLTQENKTSPSARKSALEKRLSGEKIPAPNCQNEALATAILKALEFNPNDRYKTAAEFKNALLNSVANAVDEDKTYMMHKRGNIKHCDKCGNQIRNVAKYCNKCGAIITSNGFNPNDRYKTAKGFEKELSNANFASKYTITSKEEPIQKDTAYDNDESEKTVRLDGGESATSITPKKEKKHKKKAWILVACIALAVIITGVLAFALFKNKKSPTDEKSTNSSHYTRSGSYITFGTYPQSEVEDVSLKSSLTSIAGNTSNWMEYNYYIEGFPLSFMKYKDVTYNGNKYRGVYFTQYRPNYTHNSSSTDNSEQDNNGYYTNTIYWFKYEPIKWKILEESNGDALLVADMLLDSQDYNHTLDNNYANSSIRTWLNSTFYNTAFNSSEQDKIKITTIDNSVDSTGFSSNSFACENTNDKIFLLSNEEVTNSSYGFSGDSMRVKNLTSYAKVQGAYVRNNMGFWWLRSPCDNNSSRSLGVFYSGNVAPYNVYNTLYGIAPALHLAL